MSDIVVAKLSAWLGFNFNDKDLLKFKIGIAAASAALIKFTADTMKTTAALSNLNIKTGVSEEFANEMGRLADVAGIGKEAIFSAFESISQAQADFKRGEGNISPYTFLGINPMDKKPEEVFQEVLKALDKFGDDAQMKTKALQDLGLDPLLQRLDLSQSPLNKELLLDKNDIKSLKELRTEISKFQTNLAILRDKFIALATPIKTFFELGNRIINGLVLLTKNTIGFEKAAKWLSGTLLILVSLIFPKFTKIGVLLLLIEDFIVYLNDGKSVIGYYIDKFKEWWNSLSGITKLMIEGLGLAIVIGKLGKILKLIKDIITQTKILSQIKSLGAATKSVKETLGKKAMSYLPALKNMGLGKMLGAGALLKTSWDIVQDSSKPVEERRLYKWTKGAMNWLGIDDLATRKRKREEKRQMEEFQLAQQTQQVSGGNKTITQTNNVEINVNSVKEAVEAEHGIKQQQLDNAVLERS